MRMAMAQVIVRPIKEPGPIRCLVGTARAPSRRHRSERTNRCGVDGADGPAIQNGCIWSFLLGFFLD